MKSAISVLKNIFLSAQGHPVSAIQLKTIKKLIFLSFILLPQLITAQTISTIAGTATQGYNGDGIAATTAQLNKPQGLAVDAYGNIYFADLNNSRIRKIDIITGLISTIAGTGAAGYNGDGIAAVTAQIAYPSAVKFDSNGDLYFTDRSNFRIRKITMSTGIISTVAGNGTGGYNGDGIAATAAYLNYPNDVSFDAAGNLYIADWLNNRVRKVDKVTGLISTIAGTGTAGYNGDGIAATSAQIDGPCGIIFDIYGNIYFAEYFNGHRIRKITTSTGLISTVAGTGVGGYNGDGIPATTAQLKGPAYIRFDAAGNLFIGDGQNYRVRKVDKITGLISTVAGTGVAGYNGDGIPATTAQLYSPYDIYFDNLNCNVYIGDCDNSRIRKITGGFPDCPVTVAPGNLLSCQVLPAVAINASNYNAWVPVYDSAGKIAVMINANGNNLGNVSTSLFTKTGVCREDVNNRLYLNRNITITPQNQPSTAVSVRLYILKAELDSLKTAMNSQNQPSGVASINEVDVFKNNDACLTVGALSALPLTATTGTYNADYYLQVNVSSFSSFYFANKLLTAILPVKIKTFTGTRSGQANVLKWEAGCSAPVNFIIERSMDGIYFETIGTFNAAGCNQPFTFTDDHPSLTENYYRLKVNEPGGTVSYSSIILLVGINSRSLMINIRSRFVNGPEMNVQVSAQQAGQIKLIIADAAGRVMHNQLLTVQPGSDLIPVHTSTLTPGIYWLYAVGREGRSNVTGFVKR